MELKDILRNRRLELGLTMKQVADAVGVSEGTISKWESGNINSMRLDKAFAISKILSLDPRMLMGQNEDEFEAELTDRPDSVWVPIIGRVAAGFRKVMNEEILGFEPVDYDLAESGRFFALRIAGDSMEPEIKKGSTAIVRCQQDADSGDVCIVAINGDEATCKRIQKTDGGIMLVSTNPAYPPKYFSAKEQKETVTIIGRVMEVRTRF